MHLLTLIRRDLLFYRRGLACLAAGAALVAMVLTGALGVGDSLAFTLRREAERRLAGVAAVAQWPGTWKIPGSVLHAEAYTQPPNGNPTGIVAFGVKDSAVDLAPREAYVNQTLFDVLGLPVGANLVLRLAQAPEITPESVAGRPPALRQVHVRLKGVFPAAWADFSLADSQLPALNIFLDRAFLADSLGLADGGNLFLADTTPEQLNRRLRSQVTAADLGFYADAMGERLVLKNRQFTLPPIVDEVFPEAPRVLTWFADRLAGEGGQPVLDYSFVAGIDPRLLPIRPGQCLVARNAGASFGGQPGLLTFHTVGPFRQLALNQHRLPAISEVDDSAFTAALTAAIPGLTDADNCTEWDAGLPVDFERVRKTDELYWQNHGPKPRLYLHLDEARQLFGRDDATAIVFPAGTTEADVMARLTAAIRAASPGLQCFSPRERALANAANGVDFKELFLGLSGAVMLAALLLLVILTRLHQLERQPDATLLADLGFAEKRIRRLHLAEMGLAILLGTTAGTAAGIGVTKILLLALGTVWRDVVGRRDLLFHVQASSLLLGFAATAVLGLAVIARRPRRQTTFAAFTTAPGRQSAATASITALAWLNVRRFWPANRLAVILLTVGIVTALGVGSYAIKTRGEEGFGYAAVATLQLPYSGDATADFGPDVLPIRMFTATHADCTNLNRVTVPTVFGVNLGRLGLPVGFLGPNGAAVDRGVLKWILKMRLGDTLEYATGSLTLEQTFAGTVFQGGVVVDLDTFDRLFPEHPGARMFLVKDPAALPAFAKKLAGHGLHAESARARMDRFDAVQNRYLAIFLQLGLLALALGLGTMALLARITIERRRQEIILMAEIGFPARQIRRLLWLEQAALLGISLAAALVVLIPCGLFANASLQIILKGIPVLAVAGLAILSLSLKRLNSLLNGPGNGKDSNPPVHA